MRQGPALDQSPLSQRSQTLSKTRSHGEVKPVLPSQGFFLFTVPVNILHVHYSIYSAAQFSYAPAGLIPSTFTFPRLTPWAAFFRPFGAYLSG
ncbi:hypothetical protein SBA2_40037 [Acidobacteriia bacterium SbA2]|nr:hypothetical protein SBA2_40037 [Acidobacteriia bacterium SbA2]